MDEFRPKKELDKRYSELRSLSITQQLSMFDNEGFFRLITSLSICQDIMKTFVSSIQQSVLPAVC